MEEPAAPARGRGRDEEVQREIKLLVQQIEKTTSAVLQKESSASPLKGATSSKPEPLTQAASVLQLIQQMVEDVEGKCGGELIGAARKLDRLDTHEEAVYDRLFSENYEAGALVNVDDDCASVTRCKQ